VLRPVVDSTSSRPPISGLSTKRLTSTLNSMIVFSFVARSFQPDCRPERSNLDLALLTTSQTPDVCARACDFFRALLVKTSCLRANSNVCVSSDKTAQVRQKNLGKQTGNKAVRDKNADDVVEQLTSNS
jgi:hypothetical protein